MFKATKEFKNALADYEIIKECPTIEIEKSLKVMKELIEGTPLKWYCLGMILKPH